MFLLQQIAQIQIQIIMIFVIFFKVFFLYKYINYIFIIVFTKNHLLLIQRNNYFFYISYNNNQKKLKLVKSNQSLNIKNKNKKHIKKNVQSKNSYSHRSPKM